MNHRNLLSLIVLCVLAFAGSAHAGPDILTANWISCSDNNQIRQFNGDVQLNSECLYQEIESGSGQRLDLICDARTADFTSAQLAYSDQGFRVLRSSIESTAGSSTLRVNAGVAPQNTQFAVVTLYANSRATLACTLSAPDPAPTPVAPSNPTVVNPQTVVAGECIDSDNDGYGWNGVASCIPEPATIPVTTAGSTDNTARPAPERAPEPEQTQSVATVTPGACVDSDGDGFGWNGVATCRITTTPVISRPMTTIQTNNSRAPGVNDITDLILITGQSNAQGAKTEVSLAVLDAPNSKVFAFTDENGWQVADLRQHWDGPNQVRHPGGNALIFPDNIPHNNFAFHFAKSLVAIDPDRVVGFVLATAPGAGIRHQALGQRRQFLQHDQSQSDDCTQCQQPHFV